MKKQLFLFALALSAIFATSAFAANAPRPLTPLSAGLLSGDDARTVKFHSIADDRDSDRDWRRGARDLDDDDYYGRAERRRDCCDEGHRRGEHYGRGMERDRDRDDRMRDGNRDRDDWRGESRDSDDDTKKD